MADVLSQSQIDALLNSMQNTDMEELHEDKKLRNQNTGSTIFTVQRSTQKIN